MNIRQMLKKSALGLAAVATLGGATLAATAADAHPHGWGPGAAVGAGILGFALGASLAHDSYRRAPVYYGPDYYYGPGYYYAPAYRYREVCRSYWRWSPRWGHYVRVVRCY